jgi:hypothetical protein
MYSPHASSFRKLVVVLEAPQPETTFQSADVTHHSQIVQSNEKPTTDFFLELIHGNDVKRLKKYFPTLPNSSNLSIGI